jgi:NIPSNAP
MNVIELRQYELRPGRRDELIELFDRELVEPQEECGMRVIAQFRDLDRPDWFVWLRGFADMAQRTEALGCFYHGPVWAQHRDAANATMIDSDNVLLLRPAPSHAPVWEPDQGLGLVEIVVRAQSAAVDGADDSLLAVLETEPAPNGFPALPVREGEQVVVTVAGFADEAQHASYRERAGEPADATQVLRLVPTDRSRLGRVEAQ